MSNVQKLTCSGLWTEPNPHAHQPEGAMDAADNVVFRRAGTWELRPGFKQVPFEGSETLDSFERPVGAVAFGGDILIQPYDAELPIRRYMTNEAYTALDDGPARCPIGSAIRSIEAGNVLFFTALDAVRKLYVAEEHVDRTVRLGAPVPHLIAVAGTASGSTKPIQPESYAAYRATISIVYPDERTVESYPSARAVVHNTHASDTCSASVIVYLPAELSLDAPTAEVYVNVYRSRNASAPPPDELFEAYPRVRITAADITAGYVELSLGDLRLDDDLGRTFYGSDSQGGFARYNARPPAAVDLAMYQGSMFALAPTYPHRVNPTLRFTDQAGGSATGDVDGIGARTSQCDVTEDSATLTNVDVLDGVQVGMMVSVHGHSIASDGPLLVVAVDTGANTVTLSEAITSGSAVDASVAFFDALHVTIDEETEVYAIRDGATLVKQIVAGQAAVGGVMDLLYPLTPRSTSLVAYGIGNLYESEDGAANGADMVGGQRNIAIERVDCSAAAFTYAATHGDEFTPALPLPTADAEDWTASERPATSDAITCTKNGEPEHFLDGRYDQIGVPGVEGLRCFAVLGGLYILKARGDGVYRLTGLGERNGWHIEQVSATCSLIHPKLACCDGTHVYAWTSEGAVRIGPGGVVPISQGPIGTEQVSMERLLDADNLETAAFALVNLKDGEIAWGVPITSDSEQIDCMRVWNTRTQTWARWFPSGAGEWATACVANTLVDADDHYGLLYLVRDDGQLYVERKRRQLGGNMTSTSVERADEEHAVTIATASALAVTIDAGSDWTPAVGDIIVRGATRCLVTAIGSATAFTVDRAGLTTGAATAFVAFDARVRWSAEFGGGPDRGKVWTHAIAHYESTLGSADPTFTMQTPPRAAVTCTPPLDATFLERLTYVDHEFPQDVRAQPGVDAATGTRLVVGLRIRSADSMIRGSGVSIKYRDTEKTGSARP